MSTSPFVVLPSSHARASDIFPPAAELEAELRATIRGEVRFDAASKALYATDASNYRHIPIGVVIPRDEADVIATVSLCRRFNAPLLSRGAGTSLAGQGCNAAVILDFSKYMNGMDEIEVATRTVKVQPGIVLDRVRDAAEKFALTFAPDPATHSRCTIGGMIGNNSCGVHALMGGKTVDNILSLDLLLYDGTRLTVGPTTEAELEAHIKAGGRTGEIYATLKHLRDTYADQVRAKFPRIPRRVSGFNLDELLPENNFNVARALVGSEGTCAVILGATLQLVESPPCRTLLGVGFSDIFLAADHVPQILQHKPIGFEGMDGYLLEAMRRKQKSLEDLELLPAGDGFLIVEFGGATQAEANAKARALAASLATLEAKPTFRIYTSAEAKRIWHIRESGLGATAFIPGVGTGWEGWEDAAVDPLQLGSYLRAIYALMQEFNYSSAMYGHFGQGCVHMRLNFDLETEKGILAFRQFMERAADIALAHGGSLSGEHGDGQARGALLPKMFGPELMEAFRTFKRIFDPTNRMNPGKLIDAHQPHEDLRLGADYNPWQPIPKLHFAYAEDNGSFASANLRCVGVGACRKTDAGTMCPSFMATGEELHSTRGRAHLLWELMQGEVLPDQWKNKQVKESLDLCLACKACKSECPVSVDMATYKAEFLAHHYEGESRPLSHYAFGRIDLFARLASFAPRTVNAFNNAPILSTLIKRALHIHPQRTFPRFAQPFTPDRRLARDPQRRRNRRTPLPDTAPQVFLWADTFNNYFHPSAMRAAHQVLTTAGFRVQLPTQHLCCGRPLYDFGMLDTAKDYLLKILNALTPQLNAGTPIVVLEPSCASVFRDELTNLLPNDPRAAKLRDQTLLLSEFLVKHAPNYRPPQIGKETAEKIIVHGHCHHKATMGMHDELALLRLTGAEVELLDSGCCGMAGPFGFEKDKFDLSQKLGERVLLPAVRSNSKAIIVSDGFSCAEQITQNTRARPKHLAEVLAQADHHTT
jgi:FAD/FMN-containing dehydrogenase/Fe-S oxidoreductase